MADRRYKLMGQGLPGRTSFNLGQLADDDIIFWDTATHRWMHGPAQDLITIDASTIDLTDDYDWTGTHTFTQPVTVENDVIIEGELHFVTDDHGIIDLQQSAGDSPNLRVDSSTIAEDGIMYTQFYRNTTVTGTGSVQFEIHKGDGTYNPAFKCTQDTAEFEVDVNVRQGHQIIINNGSEVEGTKITHQKIELGGASLAASSFIDFHYHGSGNILDYDARIICGSSGSTVNSGWGSLQYYAQTHQFLGRGSLHFSIDGINDAIAVAGAYSHFTNNNTITIYCDSYSNTTTHGNVNFRNLSGTTKCQVLSGGNLYNASGVYGTISDIDLKENIVDETDGLNVLRQIKPINYTLKNEFGMRDEGDEQYRRKSGFSAQEVRSLVPEAVVWLEGQEESEQDENGPATSYMPGHYAVNTVGLIPSLVNGIKEVDAENDRLRGRIRRLEDRLDALENA